MKPVYVRWVDSGRSDGWESPEDALKKAKEDDMTCESIAWLVGEDKDWILLSSSKHEGEVLSLLQIPRVAVKEIRTVQFTQEAFLGTGWEDEVSS